jgi:hypothetical protein
MPLFLRTLLRHYYNKLIKDNSRENASAVVVALRSEELMYDEAFSIARVSYHSPSIGPFRGDIPTTESYGNHDRVCCSYPDTFF